MKRWHLVAALYSDGQTAAQIAPQLATTPDGIKSSVKYAKKRLLPGGIGTRFDLRTAMIRAGMLQP